MTTLEEKIISRIKKHIERTNIPQEILSHYALTIDETKALEYYGQKLGMIEAIFLAFDFGLCKGYRAGNVKRVKERTVK